MKHVIIFVYVLLLFICTGCSESIETADPLELVLLLNEDYESQFIGSAQDSVKSKVALGYFRIQQPDKAQNVMGQIKNQHKKIWAMSRGALILNEQGSKVLSEKLITEALLLANKTKWIEEEDNDYTYQVLMEVLGKLKKYEDASKVVKKFKKPHFAVISIDRVARDAIEIEEYEVAKTFLNLGFAYGKQHLLSHPQLAKSIQYLAWGYYEIGDFKKARELLRVLAEHDMNRNLEKQESVKYMFSSYEQKLLMTEQYDLALKVVDYVKGKLKSSQRNNAITRIDLELKNADIAVIYALRDGNDFSKALRLIESLTDKSVRLFGYKSAAKKLHDKGRTEDASYMLRLARKEVVFTANSTSMVNDAVSLAYAFMELEDLEGAAAMLEWASQNLEGYDEPGQRLSYLIRIVKIYENMGDLATSNRLLAKIDGLFPLIEAGRAKDGYIIDVAEIYCKRGNEIRCKEGLSQLENSLNHTDVLRELVDLQLEKGNFEAALEYISQIQYRSTVMIYLQILAVDMYNQKAQLGPTGVALLSKIAHGDYE